MTYFFFAILVPPQDTGVINGFTEYSEQSLKYFNSKSIIHLKMAIVEMSGQYTCTISTFQEEDMKRTKMIVYGKFIIISIIIIFD